MRLYIPHASEGPEDLQTPRPLQQDCDVQGAQDEAEDRGLRRPVGEGSVARHDGAVRVRT